MGKIGFSIFDLSVFEIPFNFSLIWLYYFFQCLLFKNFIFYFVEEKNLV